MIFDLYQTQLYLKNNKAKVYVAEARFSDIL